MEAGVFGKIEMHDEHHRNKHKHQYERQQYEHPRHRLITRFANDVQ